MTSIHGHKVLELILSSAPNQSLTELRQLVINNFGTDAIYHTCSESDMDLDSLLAFFVARGKVAGDDGALNVDETKICQHH
ncbi:DUF2492 family protein [Corallincola luteus]|uniref:DUF2492 family protein n=1 Tax=Corallincola luteus TaxID=1775177 RepID=A0ABY2AM65_9GAMM|nr:YecH family metal-binding protein [Corallincola luteus]TCI04045.1 DUF2492 family protein [Corallincola luteus]